MIITIIIGIVVGIPLLLAVIWILNMLWLSIVNLFRTVIGSDKPHGCSCDYPEAIKKVFKD